MKAPALPVILALGVLIALPAWAEQSVSPQLAIDRDRQVLSAALDQLLNDKSLGAQQNIIASDRLAVRAARDQLHTSMRACRKVYSLGIATVAAKKATREPVPCQ